MPLNRPANSVDRGSTSLTNSRAKVSIGNRSDSSRHDLAPPTSTAVADAVTFTHTQKGIDCSGQRSKDLVTNGLHRQEASDSKQGPSTSSPGQAPMLKQWLDEGSRKTAGRFGDQDVYPKGARGMTQYLNGWNNTWDCMAKDAEARRKA